MTASGPSAPDKGTGRLSNLHIRTLSAVVMIAIAVALTWVGGVPFALMASAIGLGVFYEWHAITLDRSSLLTRGVAWACLIVVLGLLLLSHNGLLIIAILLAGAALTAMLGGRQSGLWPAIGLLYAGFPAIA
ncbi:MAG: phosphatidate cytidylyltransferase, partial [Phyllobacterium sp.]|nr:phosphatidate cytidylyltransferase [Phyllobacterium sp.]